MGIDWADGSASVIPLREIRLACGCAVCRDELTGAPLLDPATIPADIRAYRIAPVGNYALTFDWSDSHSTGIFPWEMLRALADRIEVREPVGERQLEIFSTVVRSGAASRVRAKS